MGAIACYNYGQTEEVQLFYNRSSVDATDY